MGPQSTRALQIPKVAFCCEKKRLLDAFVTAIHEISVLNSQLIGAVIEGDEEFPRFDTLLSYLEERFAPAL